MTRILVVDDSPTETHVLKDMLEKHDYHVSVALDGEQGMTKAHKEQPDLILMDIVMPGINGFKVTRKLAKDSATGSIPIIIISTKNQDTDRDWGMRQGAVDYITKPVVEGDLVTKINAALKG